MRKFIEASLTFGFGLIVSLLALELGLNLLGSFYHHRLTSQQGSSDNGHYTILCLGDSFTYGIGATSEQSYPRQLEKLLNTGFALKRYRVINQGQLAQNTGQMLRDFETNLDKFHPSMILVMTGINNNWNYVGYHEYLNRYSGFAKLQDWLYQVKLYKLGRLLYLNFKTAVSQKGNLRKPDTFEENQPRSYLEHNGILAAFGDTSGVAWASLEVQPEDEALNQLKQAVKAQPDNFEPYLKVGDYLQRQGNYDEALKWYCDSLAFSQPNSRGCSLILDICRRQRNHAQISAILEHSLRTHPKNANLYQALAMVYSNAGQFDKALHLAKQALALQPDNHRNYQLLGNIYASNNQYLQALEWMHKGLQAEPDNYNYFIDIGEIYQSQRQYSQAISWFKKYLAARPDDPQSYKRLAEIYRENRDYGMALKYANQGLKLRPDPQSYRVAASIHAAMGKPGQAMADLHQALKLAPNDARLHLDLGNLYMESFKYPEALNCLKTSVRLEPGSDAAYCKIGWIYYLQGNHPEALRWYKQAILVNPASAAGMIPRMMEIFEKNHDYDGALKLFEELARVNPVFWDIVKNLRARNNFNIDAEKWISADLSKMIGICKARGIIMVIMDYPGGLNVGESRRSEILRQVAEQNAIPFVDNYKVFNALPDNSSYFMPDGHCNAKGYAVLARNAFRAIQPLLP